jgi:hypothetical protein
MQKETIFTKISPTELNEKAEVEHYHYLIEVIERLTVWKLPFYGFYFLSRFFPFAMLYNLP